MDSVWSLLVSNVALMVNVVVSVVSMVFGGGTAILNSVLEVVSSRYLLTFLQLLLECTLSIKTNVIRVL